MKIDDIRNQIAEKLSNDCETWKNVLNHTQPENYSCDHWKVEINPTDVQVDIHNNYFSINDGFFTSAIILNSNIQNSNESYNKAFSAKGKFELETESTLRLEEIDIDIEIDIF